MKTRKLLPLSLSIAAISLLAVGFGNVAIMASASTPDVVVPVAETPAAPPVVPLVAPGCGCDQPGDCGLPGCPQAACTTTGCAGKAAPAVVPVAAPGCLCQDGGCDQPGCPGAGCDGTNCPALQGQGGCGCGADKASTGCGGSGCGAQTSPPPSPRSGCGCG